MYHYIFVKMNNTIGEKADSLCKRDRTGMGILPEWERTPGIKKIGLDIKDGSGRLLQKNALETVKSEYIPIKS